MPQVRFTSFDTEFKSLTLVILRKLKGIHVKIDILNCVRFDCIFLVILQLYYLFV